MIGTATWSDPESGYTRTVVLNDDLTWECPDDPDAAHAYAYIYRDWPTGPSAGRPGHAMLNDLAASRGGVAWFEPKTPDPPGTVY